MKIFYDYDEEVEPKVIKGVSLMVRTIDGNIRCFTKEGMAVEIPFERFLAVVGNEKEDLKS